MIRQKHRFPTRYLTKSVEKRQGPFSLRINGHCDDCRLERSPVPEHCSLIRIWAFQPRFCLLLIDLRWPGNPAKATVMDTRDICYITQLLSALWAFSHKFTHISIDFLLLFTRFTFWAGCFVRFYLSPASFIFPFIRNFYLCVPVFVCQCKNWRRREPKAPCCLTIYLLALSFWLHYCF